MLFVAICGGLVAIFVYAQITEKKGDNSSNVTTSTSSSTSPFHLTAFDPHHIRDISFPDLTFAAEKAVHCVVHVKIKSLEDTYANIFDYFSGRRSQVPREGFVGSGVIVSSDGYIVTNNHVIRRSEEIEVVLNDQRSFTATLVGTDSSTDLALLKIEETGLPFLAFGDSEAIRVGEWVLAVGNPYNLTSTVTSGIVSAKARRIGILDTRSQLGIESFIQTDAAVNPGNSGGALVNIRGELIGINTAIASRTGEFSGNAFAIPATIAEKVIGDLKEFGKVQRALLGITFNEKADKEKEELFIVNVQESWGAAIAGIKVGDVMTAINDVTIKTFSEFQGQISKYRPNDKIKVSIIRDKKTQHFDVILRNIDGTTEILRGDNSGDILGATFEAVSQKEKQDLGIKSGVRVKEVGQGKLSTVEGIRNGFIITSVNEKAVNSAKDIQAIIDSVDSGGQILIKGVNRRGSVSWHIFKK